MDHIAYAQVIGLTVLMVSLGILTNLSHAKKMAAQMIPSSVGFVLGGVIPTLIGSWAITQHNIWTGFWPITMTIIGWFIFFLGIFRLWFVKIWIKLLEENIKYLPILFALFGLMGGLLLCYIGFFSHKF